MNKLIDADKLREQIYTLTALFEKQGHHNSYVACDDVLKLIDEAPDLSLAGYSANDIAALMGQTRPNITNGLEKMREALSENYPWHAPIKRKYAEFQSEVKNIDWTVVDADVATNKGFVNIFITPDGETRCNGIYNSFREAEKEKPENTVAIVKVIW